MPAAYNLAMAGQQLELRADRSLWWPTEKILFIADIHAGKTEHFQRAGLAVPHGNLMADLSRLGRSIHELKPKRVIVLGDLFHSDMNSEWQTVVDWIKRQSCSIELVRGNHDRFIDNATFAAGGLMVHQEGLQVGPFILRHHPAKSADKYVLCGHLHPVHTFAGPGSDRLRLACFVISQRQVILPAYGSFTGGYKVSRSAGLLIGTAPDFQNVIY